ncbi:hypothetical protein AAVH_02829 [Aphelenchoides avenae]|nr:hypothetical protein AAVH_02829 [Aphelenchus avenae]
MRMRGEARAAALSRVQAAEAQKQGGNVNCRVCRSAPASNGQNAPAGAGCESNAPQQNGGVACQNPIGMQLLDPHKDALCNDAPVAPQAATPAVQRYRRFRRAVVAPTNSSTQPAAAGACKC